MCTTSISVVLHMSSYSVMSVGYSDSRERHPVEEQEGDAGQYRCVYGRTCSRRVDPGCGERHQWSQLGL